MRKQRVISIIIISLLCCVAVKAAQWTTYFAYNNVTQIAMATEKVYAISDGSLFCVDKQSEKITKYDRQSGLHSTGINCIHYDSIGNQLIIAYSDGKIDVLSENGVKYLSELYDKDMTQRKTIYNVTIKGRTAYFSTHYGVQTMDLRENKLVDSYWLRPSGQETPIGDVRIIGDSIYAFGGKVDSNNKVVLDSLYSAALSDNLSDYNFWTREKNSGRIAQDTEKGTHYQDASSNWYAGGANGIKRVTATETINYKPDGPLVNLPYRLRIAGNRVGIVQGGYAVPFFNRKGMVMLLEDGHWLNYDQGYMTSHLGINNSKDYCDIAFDPADSSHFFVASFGYGLMEFRKDTFFHHYNNSNSAVEPVIENLKYPYLWMDGLRFDNDGNLWMLNVGTNGVKVFTSDSMWYSFSCLEWGGLPRTQDLLISNQNANIKVISSISNGLGIIDDNGTIADVTDDKSAMCTTFQDANGNDFILTDVHTIFQSSDGALLIGTESGLFRIPNLEDLLNNNNLCINVKIDIPEDGREDIFATEVIQSIIEDEQSHLWIATQATGVYCLSSDLSTVLYHFSTDNSPLPCNDVLSLGIMTATQQIFIGTTNGLCAFKIDEPEGPTSMENTYAHGHSYGSMKRWKTHFSYNNATSLEDAGDIVYALSSGAVLTIDKETEEPTPLSKLTGLNGGGIINLCYNSATSKTLLLYQNGLIDIVSPNGKITSMPDVVLSTITNPCTFYTMYSHGERIYICSSAGILSINMKRNEVSETYVLRDNNSDVYPQHVCINGDSIYAASPTKIYTAALKANLIDGAVWQSLPLPPSSQNGTIEAVGCVNNSLIVHIDSILYSYQKGIWQTILPTERWQNLYVHSTGLVGRTNQGIYRIYEDSYEKLSIPYIPNDIAPSLSDYWIAVSEENIIRWNKNETQAFSTNSPYENLSYRIRIYGDKIIVLPGGYWADFYYRKGNVMICEGGMWNNITYRDIFDATGGNLYYDFCDAAVDPFDASHLYVSSFGFGLHEFKDGKYTQWLMPWNTPNGLESVISNEVGYTWVDGLQYDKDGNLWMLNNSYNGVKVFLRNGSWIRISNQATHDLSRTKDLLIWNRDANIKILTCARATAGIGVFNDKGTIENTSDDEGVFCSSFIDQNGKQIQPQFIYSICQMANGEIWVGTESGIIILSDVSKLLKHDNHCKRVIIPRNDGTGLGDYLLGEERINAIAEDAAGRKWIGTATSGLYLVSEDGIETYEHFTLNNSPLVSNEISSLAIHHASGEVYIGTSLGLLSYQSDANAAQKNLSSVYAYPNPVYPAYTGYICITGLMENTVVNIVDEGGNLVCKTRSNGGMAIWDGRDAYGQRAKPGIYTALCNAGGNHNTCKILILHASR